jgi:hypothetical protein
VYLDLRGRKWREAGEDCIMRIRNFYVSPNIIRVFKSIRMSWMWHVAHMGEMRNYTKFGSEKLYVRWEIILGRIFGK